MTNNNHILFDKYEVIKTLGAGSFSEVLLVRHQSLEQNRAIKIYPKKSGTFVFDASEAKLLTSFDHPGIPKVYDIEEDESFFYIVEEYLDGEGLDKFLLRQHIISPIVFFNFCEQLCDIFTYLHRDAPTPIIYRDLKPEHIIVCQNQLKLIDYGVSSYVSNSGNNFNHLGNLSFSAPECFTENRITPLADIYSIGKLISYMSGYLDRKISLNIQKISQKATEETPALRYETVEALGLDLKKAKEVFSSPQTRKKIAVIGTHAGCGCTHVAVSINAVLNSIGLSSLYIDNNLLPSMNISDICPKGLNEHNGILYYRLFSGLPGYGKGIQVNIPEVNILVYDLGHNFNCDDLYDMDQVILVCNNSFWHIDDLTSSYKKVINSTNHLKILCNLSDRHNCHSVASLLKEKIYLFPCTGDASNPDKEIQEFIQQLLSDKEGILSDFKRKNRFFNHHRS